MQDDVITQATRAAHQAALDEHVRIKGDLSKHGISVDDFTIMDRYPLADFGDAIERNPEA